MNEEPNPFYRVSDDGTEILAGIGEQEISVASLSDCNPDALTTMCDLASMSRAALNYQQPDEEPNVVGAFVTYATDLIGKLRDTLAKARVRAGGQWHQELIDNLTEADSQAKRLLSALGTGE